MHVHVHTYHTCTPTAYLSLSLSLTHTHTQVHAPLWLVTLPGAISRLMPLPSTCWSLLKWQLLEFKSSSHWTRWRLSKTLSSTLKRHTEYRYDLNSLVWGAVFLIPGARTPSNIIVDWSPVYTRRLTRVWNQFKLTQLRVNALTRFVTQVTFVVVGYEYVNPG